jgi:hypothetical protein
MAATDLLSEEEARSYLRMGAADTSQQTLLTAYVTAASARIVEAVGPVVYGTLTESHDGGSPVVWLNSTPVQGVTQVVEFDDTVAGTLTAESNSSHPADSYVVNLVNGRLTRRDSGADSLFPTGVGNVQVTYVAGRVASTAAVPERYKLACGLFLQHLWRAQENAASSFGEFEVPQASYPKFGVPNVVKDLLADEWRTGSGVGD